MAFASRNGFFKKMTIGKTVLMGRKTFESLPKPLVDRKNVVLTRQTDFHPEGCEIVHSIKEALELYTAEELVVIGGADIYEQFLPFANQILLTKVEADIEGGDAFFLHSLICSGSLWKARAEIVMKKQVCFHVSNVYSVGSIAF